LYPVFFGFIIAVFLLRRYGANRCGFLTIKILSGCKDYNVLFIRISHDHLPLPYSYGITLRFFPERAQKRFKQPQRKTEKPSTFPCLI